MSMLLNLQWRLTLQKQSQKHDQNKYSMEGILEVHFVPARRKNTTYGKHDVG